MAASTVPRSPGTTLSSGVIMIALATLCSSQENHRITWNVKDIPYLYLQLRNIAQDRVYWGRVTCVPTQISDSQEQHTMTDFSQAPEDR